ncbi:MAG: hypothetical protein ACQEWV_17690 [Bacillota bacterium]
MYRFIIGNLLWNVTDNIGFGMAMGHCFGVAIGSSLDKKNKKK